MSSLPIPRLSDPVEVVGAVLDGNTRLGDDPFPVGSPAAVVPTQIRRPWRSTLRSAWQTFIGLCVLAPILVQVAGVDVDQLPWLVVPLAIAAFVTRAMADPRVEVLLRQLPVARWLAAAPPPS